MKNKTSLLLQPRRLLLFCKDFRNATTTVFATLVSETGCGKQHLLIDTFQTFFLTFVSIVAYTLAAC